MANPSTVTAPQADPVSLDEAKQHARIPHTVDDAYVAALIDAATLAVQNFLNSHLVNTTLDYFSDEFPWHESEIELPGGRLQSITSLKYTDSDGDEHTVDPSVYFAITRNEPGALRLAYNAAWPSATLKPAEAVAVRYVVGYGAAATDVPEDIRHAILMTVATLYGFRENFIAGTIISKLPSAATALLYPYRIETRF